MVGRTLIKMLEVSVEVWREDGAIINVIITSPTNTPLGLSTAGTLGLRNVLTGVLEQKNREALLEYAHVKSVAEFTLESDAPPSLEEINIMREPDEEFGIP